MNIVIEENIPLAEKLFSQHFNIELLTTHDISSAALKNCDILVVRSTTRVDAALLENTPVKIVATPTSGVDHIDLNYLQKTQRQFFHAPGCNALAVAHYVACCVSALREMAIFKGAKLTAGVIGVGHVGQLVAKILRQLNFEVRENDPPRAAREADFKSTPLIDLRDADLLCIHTPLTFDGPFATHGLINKAVLARQKRGSVILNAGRGAVLDMTQIPLMKHLHFCCDVFTQEPDIDISIVPHLTLATPHIAGHAIEAKLRGTEMIYQKICETLGIAPDNRTVKRDESVLWQFEKWESLEKVLLKFYDPRNETYSLKAAHRPIAKTFLSLRKQHLRHEFSFPKIHFDQISDEQRELLQLLEMNCC